MGYEDLSTACLPIPPVDPVGRELSFDPSWRTETVVALVRGIEVEAAFDRMPILADALEEAGCDLVPLLNHCRCGTTHAPGCWVLNLIQGREQPELPPVAPQGIDPRMLQLLRQATEQRAAATWPVQLPVDPRVPVRLIVLCLLIGFAIIRVVVSLGQIADRNSTTPTSYPTRFESDPIIEHPSASLLLVSP